MTRYYICVPVMIIEDRSLSDSLSRSAVLTDGHRWKIFALYFVPELAYSIASGTADLSLLMVENPTIYFILSIALLLAYTIITSIIMTVIYFELINEKEGGIEEDLSEVFV